MADGSGKNAEMPDGVAIKIFVPEVENHANTIYYSTRNYHLKYRGGHSQKERVASKQHAPAHQKVDGR